MRQLLIAVVVATIFWSVCCCSITEADVTVLVEATSLNDLVGDAPILVGSGILTTSMTSTNLAVEVLSAAYTGSNGIYAYLYQVDNVGDPENTAIEMFTLWPFSDSGDNAQVGWLSADVPGFLTGGVDSDDRAFLDGVPADLEVSFYFTKLYSLPIDIGQHSKILYVLSQDTHTLITGNVIGGTVGSGQVVGPGVIPEPGTLAYLFIGALTALFARRRRQ